jgi:hypothetical protein
LGIEGEASEVVELEADAGCCCCTVVAIGEVVVEGVGTGAESERETFPEDAEPEAEVEYPLDILETRFLQRAKTHTNVSLHGSYVRDELGESDKTLLDWHSEKSGDPWSIRSPRTLRWPDLFGERRSRRQK